MKKLLLALVGAAALPVLAQAPAQQAGGRVATAAFAQLPFMTQPRLSPDGSKVAMQLSHGGTTHIAVLDLAVPNAKPMIIASAGEYREVGDRTIADWSWVGNDNVVVTLASRENIYGQRYDVTRLFAYNLKTKKIVPLAWEGALGQASEILHVNHETGKFLLERQSEKYGTERWFQPEVVEVDVTTGKYTIVMRPNPVVDRWFADGNGIVRAGIGNDRKSGVERLLYRSSERDTFDTVAKAVDKDFTGAQVRPSIFLGEPDMAIVTSNHDGYRKVYKANLKTMEFGQPIFQAKGFDVGNVQANDDRNKLLGVRVTAEGERSHWLDSDWKTVQHHLDQAFGRGNARIESSNVGDTRFIVQVGAPHQAGAYYFYDTATGDFARLGWRHVALRERKLNPVSTIRYRASDGQMVPAVVTMPRHRSGKNLPLVIITHGGPFGVRDAESYDEWPQAVAELGYVVVQPNYRGSGGYGTEWQKIGRNNGFGLRMQDDLDDAITHLAGQGIVDPKRVCMMGWSYGGYAAARAAQRNPDKYRCTIAGAGVYDLPMMKSYDANYLGSFGVNYLAKASEDLAAVSPAANTQSEWAPIMIVHGVRDQRVPVAQARTLASRLKSSGKRQGVDYEYLEQPKNTHHLPYDDVRREWLEATETWLTKHNPAYIDSDADKPVKVDITLR